jgi:hypothetical protein
MSKNFPDFVSRFYETHRHYGLNITLDVQRPGLIDLNIRALATEFIEILETRDEIGDFGDVLSSDFKCRVYGDYSVVEKYIDSGTVGAHELRRYTHSGNVYALYDSYFFKHLHVDGRQEDFDLFRGTQDAETPEDAERIIRFFDSRVPDTYWHKNLELSKRGDKIVGTVI